MGKGPGCPWRETPQSRVRSLDDSAQRRSRRARAEPNETSPTATRAPLPWRPPSSSKRKRAPPPHPPDGGPRRREVSSPAPRSSTGSRDALARASLSLPRSHRRTTFQKVSRRSRKPWCLSWSSTSVTHAVCSSSARSSPPRPRPTPFLSLGGAKISAARRDFYTELNTNKGWRQGGGARILELHFQKCPIFGSPPSPALRTDILVTEQQRTCGPAMQ